MLRYQNSPDVADELRNTHPAAALLMRAHRPDQATQIFDEKVRTRPLILRPSSPDTQSKDARSSRRLKRLRKKEHYLRKRKPRPLSAKERRRLGVHDIPDDKVSRTWKTYLPLRDLWQEYAREILDIQPPSSKGADYGRYVTGASVGPKLAAADFHGAELQVVRSNCVSRVGVHGIVLKDTKFTFELITPQNEIKIISKAHTVFRFQVDRDVKPSTPRHECCEDCCEKCCKECRENALEERREVKHENRLEDKNEDDSNKNRTERGNGKHQDKAEDEHDDNNHINAMKPPPKPFVFEIHGDQFETRPEDRAAKKFKAKRLDHL